MAGLGRTQDRVLSGVQFPYDLGAGLNSAARGEWMIHCMAEFRETGVKGLLYPVWG